MPEPQIPSPPLLSVLIPVYNEARTLRTIIGRVLTFLYFMFFITMPLWTKLDRTKPVPERVTMHD